MRITQSLLSWRSLHGKNIHSPLRSRAWAFLPSAAALLTLLLSTASSSFAGSATWLASPATGDWNTATNWTAGGPPNASTDTATFASSNKTGVSLSLSTVVNGIVFNAGANAFTITASPTFGLTISGVGITNNSGITQKLVTAVAGLGNRGAIAFTNSAMAGSLTAFTNNGSTVNGAFGGFMDFFNTSTAGSGTFINNAGTVSGANGGFTDFANSATAGDGTFTNNGGAVSGANGGFTRFFDSSTANNGTFTNNGGAVSGAGGGFMEFNGTSSTAGNATMIANGGLGAGGSILFFSDSTDGTARVADLVPACAGAGRRRLDER